MNIYKLTEQYLQIAEQLTDGESTPELEQALQITESSLQEKAVNYGYVIKQMQAEADVLKKEEQRLAAMRKSRENAAERLKNTIDAAMRHCRIFEIKGETIKLSYRASKSVEITDENLIPAKYKTEVVTEKISKTDIGNDIKAGDKVPGAELVENQNLQIK